MTWEKWAISLLPVPVFYLIYYRYFMFRPEYLKHLESFLSGIAFAFAMVLVSPYLFSFINFTDPLAVGLLKAALPEKIGACLILIFIYRYYPNFSIMEAVISASIFGLGFSAVENLFYSLTFGYNVIILRVLFSVPMHLTTCGMMGYYLGQRTMSETGIFKTIFLFKALLLSIIFHGIFDTILLQGGYISYAAPPLLITMVVVLEIMMAKSQTIPPFNIIKAMKLRFEDWLLLERQPRFERWILQSMGTRKTDQVHFFLWRPGFIRFFIVLLLLVVAIFCLANREEIVSRMDITFRRVDQIILFGNFPVSISVIIILVGAVNPVFFTNSVIRIPVISDLVIMDQSDFEETLVTYDISSVNCFIRTAEPFGMGSLQKFRFECSTFSSDELTGEVVWENHTNPRISTGTIIRFTGLETPSFKRFIMRYHLFRLRKGIIFNLKLPGFEATRKLFMRPITTMQSDTIYPPGSIIFHEHDKGSEFYLLKRGRILFHKTTENGDKIIMDTIEDQQIFGEMAVVGNVTRATTAVCETECVVAVADRENLTALIRSNTDFALSLIETLAHRVQNSEKILLDTIKTLDMQVRNKDRLYQAACITGLSLLAGRSMDAELAGEISETTVKIVEDSHDANISLLTMMLSMAENKVPSEEMEEKIRLSLKHLVPKSTS